MKIDKKNIKQFTEYLSFELSQGYNQAKIPHYNRLEPPIFKISLDGQDKFVKYEIRPSFHGNHGTTSGKYHEDQNKSFAAEFIYILDHEPTSYEEERREFPCSQIISLRDGKIISFHELEGEYPMVYGRNPDNANVCSKYEGKHFTTFWPLWMSTTKKERKLDFPGIALSKLEKAQTIADKIKESEISPLE